jgi:hypothetical protein
MRQNIGHTTHAHSSRKRTTLFIHLHPYRAGWIPSRISFATASSYKCCALLIFPLNCVYFNQCMRCVISLRWHFVSEQRNILHEIRKRKANWISHILRRNFLLKEVIVGQIKGRIEVTRRRGRRRKKLLDDLGNRRGYSHLKEEALDRIKWRNRFGRGCGPVVWQITDEDEDEDHQQ